MKVYQKLLLSYLFISLVGCIGGYFGIKAMNDIQNRFDKVSNETIPVKNELHQMHASINHITIYTNEIIFLKIKQHKIVLYAEKILLLRQEPKHCSRKLKTGI